MHSRDVSIVLPCLNEPATIGGLVKKIETLFPDAQVIIVDDGSSPALQPIGHLTIVRHPTTMGNGAAIKTGVRNAERDYIVLMDADGQHDPAEIPRLLEQLEAGYEMAVGARRIQDHASLLRRYANAVFNRLASILTGFRIDDLTSGFRAARTKTFRNFLYLLPNGFSYPATSTMAFLRCGHPLSYVPIDVGRREGASKIKLLRDGTKFLLIILRIGALYSPMRFFLPISAFLAMLGFIHYGYTYFYFQRFTNMSALLFMSALLTFLIAIVSEQVSMLHYRYSEERRRSTDTTLEKGKAG